MAVKRKYPVGIQSFEKLRTDGYIYVDKPPLIYKMITEEKLTTSLNENIQRHAGMMGESYDDTFAELKRMYDGYHFSKRKTDIYNPFSLVNAMYSGEITKYWFNSAT